MLHFLASSSFRPTFVIEAADLAAAKAAADLLALEGERIRIRELAAVATTAEAWELFDEATAEESYHDNYRAAYADDVAAMADYDAKVAAGCCGSADIAYLVAGRLYYIGCNYGH